MKHLFQIVRSFLTFVIHGVVQNAVVYHISQSPCQRTLIFFYRISLKLS